MELLIDANVLIDAELNDHDRNVDDLDAIMPLSSSVVDNETSTNLKKAAYVNFSLDTSKIKRKSQ
jgi:hypothetical protein